MVRLEVLRPTLKLEGFFLDAEEKAAWAVCTVLYDELALRFPKDIGVLREAVLSMYAAGKKAEDYRVPTLTAPAQELVNKYRGDSRGGGIEKSLMSLWHKGQKARV